jgi:hypothetical protein
LLRQRLAQAQNQCQPEASNAQFSCSQVCTFSRTPASGITPSPPGLKG